jgi:hypothetical protein
MALRDAIAVGALVGWNMTQSGSPGLYPQSLLFTKGSEIIKADITWGTTGTAEGNPLVIIYSYSANSGGVYDTIGTITMAYDSLGAMTSATWS